MYAVAVAGGMWGLKYWIYLPQQFLGVPQYIPDTQTQYSNKYSIHGVNRKHVRGGLKYWTYFP